MGKLLFFPVLTYGHFNCCINLGESESALSAVDPL